MYFFFGLPTLRWYPTLHD